MGFFRVFVERLLKFVKREKEKRRKREKEKKRRKGGKRGSARSYKLNYKCLRPRKVWGEIVSLQFSVCTLDPK